MNDERGTSAAGQGVDQLVAPRPEPARGGRPPDEASLARILGAATTVPDHGGLRPWRFAVIKGPGQERFGQALVDGLHQLRGSDVPEAAVVKMRGKSTAAPCAVMVISSPTLESNVPEWEQEVSASCTGYAMVLAACALGLGAVWKSAAVLEAPAMRELFVLRPHERLLGWINLGSPAELGRKARTDGDTGDLDGLVTLVAD